MKAIRLVISFILTLFCQVVFSQNVIESRIGGKSINDDFSMIIGADIEVSIDLFKSGTLGEINDTLDVVGRKYEIILNNQRYPSYSMDISHLANGMYFLKIETENGVMVKKVVKE